jgi:hypothetical protein
VESGGRAPKQAARQPDEAMSSRASSWASIQTRRCRAAEEMRGPPSGRAQEGRRQPRDEVSGSRPHWRRAFTFYLQGDRRFYFKHAFSGCVFGALLSLVLEGSIAPNFGVKRTGLAAGPLKLACCLPVSGRVIGSAPEWIAPLVFRVTRRFFPVALCWGLFGVERSLVACMALQRVDHR